jgi:two-component system response regulator YesN
MVVCNPFALSFLFLMPLKGCGVMRKHRWFYKQLFSYLPVFFLICSFLLYITFLLISEQSKKSALQANQMVAEQTMQLIEHTLRTVDERVVTEILTNRELLSFFYTDIHESHHIYEVAKVLRDIIGSVRLIDSIYLYDIRSGYVLTQMQSIPLDEFTDKQFIQSYLSQNTPFLWSGIRPFKESSLLQESVSVVSFVRRVPVPNSKYGYMVINIREEAIRDVVQRFRTSGNSFVHLYDNNGRLITGTKDSFKQMVTEAPLELSEVVSEYNGWIVRSGFNQGQLFNVLHGFSNVLVAIGIVAMVLGMVWIIYITKRNYKPIESLISRIDRFGIFGKEKFSNEMNLIESALTDLMERSQFYESRHQDDLIYRQRQLFHELSSGQMNWNDSEFRSCLELLKLPSDFEYIFTAAVEIDHFVKFEKEYSLKDQYLLKFALRSVVQELSSEHKVPVWLEWSSDRQLNILYLMSGEAMEIREAVIRLSTDLNQWVKVHLPFTVTVAIGSYVDSHKDLPGVIDETSNLLKYKSVLGVDRIIGLWEIREQKGNRDVTLNHLHIIREMTQAYKNGSSWQDMLTRFFDNVKESLVNRDDLSTLSHFLVYSFHKEMMELPTAYREVWKTISSELGDAVHTSDTIEELENTLKLSLIDFENQLSEFKNQKTNYMLIQEVKAYIGQHYHNESLSLNHISETFNISTTYFSRLFKEETGETFVSFLIQVRLEQAKHLLLETTLSVQDIAIRVGYLHPFSFIRVFKKEIGMTPGDYRKDKGHGQSASR